MLTLKKNSLEEPVNIFSVKRAFNLFWSFHALSYFWCILLNLLLFRQPGIGNKVFPCSHLRPDDRYNTVLHGILSTTES